MKTSLQGMGRGREGGRERGREGGRERERGERKKKQNVTDYIHWARLI